jgi:hypothetical protein
LEVQLTTFARNLAAESAGNNMAARIAIMAMTTNNSINVNARQRQERGRRWFDISLNPIRVGFMISFDLVTMVFQ